MASPSLLYGQLRAAAVIVVVALGAPACDDDPSGPREEFPNELYSIGFEAPAFQGGHFAGQDQWFAALGPEAATVVSQNLRGPKDGARSLQIDGSRLDDLQGFHFGSYARPLGYAPLQNGMPRVVIEGWVAVAGGDGPTCGNGLGLTSTLAGNPVPNILIGIQAHDGAYVPYLSNYDGVVVYGAPYRLAEWLHVRAVLDFESRTVQGFVNGVSIGQVPFTQGIGDEITYMNISLGSSKPIPSVMSYFDGIRVAAGPRSQR